MAIPLATTTFAILRLPAQTDGYPDAEPVYAAVANGIRAHITIATRFTTGGGYERELSTVRFVMDPPPTGVQLQPFDVLRDETTGRLWRIEWFEPRPGFRGLEHIAGMLRHADNEAQADTPRTA